MAEARVMKWFVPKGREATTKHAFAFVRTPVFSLPVVFVKASSKLKAAMTIISASREARPSARYRAADIGRAIFWPRGRPVLAELCPMIVTGFSWSIVAIGAAVISLQRCGVSQQSTIQG